MRHVLTAIWCAAWLSGCDSTCDRLAERLCEQASLANDKNADRQCEAWRARTARVSPAVCAGALKRLDKQP